MKQLQPGITSHKANEISIYNGAPATLIEISGEVAKLKAVFPAIDKLYVSILVERLSRNEFTLERLKDAVGNVIDNFHYQKPNIADIINFDRRMELLTHNEAYIAIENGKVADWSDFELIEVGGIKFRVIKSEYYKYHTKKP